MHRNFTAVDPARSRATANFYRAAGPRLDFNAVRAAAAGRWPAILTDCGIDAAHLTDRHGPCPGCGGTDRFRFDDEDGSGSWLCGGAGRIESGDGFGLLAHCHGWTATECLHAVADVLGLREGRPLPPVQPRSAPPAQPDPAEVERTRARFNRLWSAGVLLDHADAEPGRRYQAARGLSDLTEWQDWPTDLRLHPAAPYWHPGPDGRPQRIAELPALLALVRAPGGEPVGLHTTWLRPDGAGKSSLTDGAGNPLPARKLRLLHRGAGAGAAVRLYAAGERLAVAEGIETALAVRVADPSLPVWSCISAGGVAGVVLPAEVREVLLIADADPAGARAVLALASRCRSEGRCVRVVVPEGGADHGA
ncbi:MAG: toprim domain-containing protein [Proteobacteria bacterium]|nr:toprim domain-containing protein [Pseudomonadota bacterium]